MIKNYLATTLRNLSRNKTYATLNILGLALGITCSMLIFLVVKFELSFDTFHSKKDQLYRINTHVQFQGETGRLPNVPFPFIEALRNDLPEFKQATVTNYVSGGLVSINREGQAPARFQEENGITYIEPQFFDLFDYTWLEGNPQTSLKDPRSVVLTESQAMKYFNETSPIGKTLRLNNTYDLKVTGILKDFPANTDFPFNVLISHTTLKEVYSEETRNNWGNLNYTTQGFVVLPEGTNLKGLETKLSAFTRKYMDEEGAKSRSYVLQPLRTIHFDELYGNYNNRIVARQTIWALSLVGAFLLITACINFVNLATAQAVKRAKEIGVRKVLGSSRRQLFWQFIYETAFITTIALVVSIVLTQAALPALRELLGLEIYFTPLEEPVVIAFIIGLLVLVSILSGFYPAMILSGFNPIQALKSKFATQRTGSLSFRRGLVVLQFCISQVLIIGTLVVTSQMDYFQNKSLGFTKDAVLTVPLPGAQNLNFETMRSELKANPGVEEVSFSNLSISSAANQRTFFTFAKKGGAVESFVTSLKFGDEHFLEMHQVKLLAGRNFIKSDTIREFVVNEAMLRQLGIKSPEEAIGQYINLYDRIKAPIVGVVSDFHVTSLRENIDAVLMASSNRSYRTANIKLNATQMKEGITHVEQVWTKKYPEHVFSYQFLDQTIANFYREEQKTSALFRIFSGIAIFIGCLGLFGLISFITAQKTKEVGIRKVLGASATNITLLFFKEFAFLVVIAFLIAAPIAYYVMNSWLENFEYQVEVGVGVFIIAVGISLVIAACTVGYQSVKAALANPIKSLRNE
ncbi:FtsX-like permease family protein [Rhodocytophaga rosea]|uniref:FtsX-like permease family protein n=1 Tax=Rhodocytophaga rosea TaxID=2704465 RepID=A0A6C0GN04_9BACT|nr:ABC transporter permease [Rhodocytophaga rosea]QHT69224.1 FtsX-like permease family protein [Rhodocytophaga rosea]